MTNPWWLGLQLFLNHRPQRYPLYLLHHVRGEVIGFVKLFLSSSPNWSLQPSIAKAQWPNNTQASFRRGVNGPKAILNFWLLWNYKEAKQIKHISKRKQRVPTCNCHLNVDKTKLFLRHWIQYPRNQTRDNILNEWHFIYLTPAKGNCSWFFPNPTIFQA